VKTEKDRSILRLYKNESIHEYFIENINSTTDTIRPNVCIKLVGDICSIQWKVVEKLNAENKKEKKLNRNRTVGMMIRNPKPTLELQV
jgi:hypothetical protein